MKKTLLTLIFIVGISTISFAQNANIKYHGEVEAGYTLGVGDELYKNDRINLRTIQGIQIGECFSTGLGLGIDYYLNDVNEMAIPVYANFKGYYPTGTDIKPYLSLNLGYGIGIGDISDLSGFMWEPAVGVKLKWLKAEVGYTSQHASIAGYGFNLNGLQLKIGVMF